MRNGVLPVYGSQHSEMGFRIRANGDEPPRWPHFICSGDGAGEGAGWAWHENAQKQRCFSADVAVNAPAEIVARAIDGNGATGIDKLLAVVELRALARSGFLRIFPDRCPVCDGDHRKRVERLLIVAKHIHPSNYAILRSARVPEDRIREPCYHRRGDAPLPVDPEELKALFHNPETDKRVKRKVTLSKNLPVYVEDKERTRVAQVRFALAYARRSGIVLRPPQPAP